MQRSDQIYFLPVIFYKFISSCRLVVPEVLLLCTTAVRKMLELPKNGVQAWTLMVEGSELTSQLPKELTRPHLESTWANQRRDIKFCTKHQFKIFLNIFREDQRGGRSPDRHSSGRRHRSDG